VHLGFEDLLKISSHFYIKTWSIPTSVTYHSKTNFIKGLRHVHSNFVFIKKTRSALHLLNRKTLGGADEDTYLGYTTEMTWVVHVRVSMGPHYN
jgi:hypothetical protein